MSSYWTHKSRPQYIRLTPVSDWQQNVQPEGFMEIREMAHQL